MRDADSGAEHGSISATAVTPRGGPIANLLVTWHDQQDLSHQRLRRLLQAFDDLFADPLSLRVNLADHVAKLLLQAEAACGTVEGEVVALLVLYANDGATKRAHVPIVAVLPKWRRQGIGRVMLSRALARARQCGMTSVDLTLSPDNHAAMRLYRSVGFRPSRNEGAKLRLRRKIPAAAVRCEATSLEANPRLMAERGHDLDIDLRIKRDDLYPMPGGGIKARKIRYILQGVVSGGHDVVVTNGGPQSNHARAAAVA